MIWIQFLVCAALIVYSGSRLSAYGDVIAERTGMGRTWIGVILMASVTSLPELVTGISSVAVYRLPDIATGDVLGSCMFNLLILAMLDIKRRGSPISAVAHEGHVLTAAFGVLMLGLIVMGIVAGPALPSIGWVGIYTPILLIAYFLAMRAVFRYEKRKIAEFLTDVSEQDKYARLTGTGVWGRYAAHAAVIFIAASYLPELGGELATVTGLGRSFAGTIFVAVTTSLPEVVVTRASLRLGAVDLAVGGILGSNLFNAGILAMDDACFAQGPILSHVSSSHAVTAASAVAMTAIVTIALSYRSGKRWLGFTWDSLANMSLFAAASYLLFRLR